MKSNETASQVTGSYVEFQAAVLRALPRDITSELQLKWTKDGNGLSQGLRQVLIPTPKFTVWKRVKLGTGLKNAEEFREALKRDGFKIGDYGNDILGKPAFTVADTEIEVDLVCVSNEELGFADGATRAYTYKRAQERGLGICPNEIGPQLRRQYKDQPKGEWVLIGMEPIAVSGGRLEVFSVGRNDRGQWLDGDDGHPDRFWEGGHVRWVFVLPTKSK